MKDVSEIDHEQLRQLMEKGYTPEAASELLLQSRRAVLDVCQRLLEAPSDELQKLLDELDAKEATDK